jgi:hypothetical protein
MATAIAPCRTAPDSLAIMRRARHYQKVGANASVGAGPGHALGFPPQPVSTTIRAAAMIAMPWSTAAARPSSRRHA